MTSGQTGAEPVWRHAHAGSPPATDMQFDSRSSVPWEGKGLLKRHAHDSSRLVDELADLVLKAYQEGEDQGKKRERRCHEE
jgi:hypothetical protein